MERRDAADVGWPGVPSAFTTPWCPTIVKRITKVLGTSTGATRAMTDAGGAYIKALGNPEGPHALICELVGTRLAAWLGLKTLDLAVFTMSDTLRIEYSGGTKSQAGPAVATREVRGRPWSGEAGDLAHVENIQDVAGLVVFDTWTRNRDRYVDVNGRIRSNLGNVFLCEEGAKPGKYILLAIDHTACFRGDIELTARIKNIDAIKDTTIYGLFDDFKPFVSRDRVEPFATRLQSISKKDVDPILDDVPDQWQMSAPIREALRELILQRAIFVGQNIENWLDIECNWQPILPFAGSS